MDETFFTRPVSDWQRRYEALRASHVDRLPARVVAGRFGYSESYVHFLRHRFKTGKIVFAEPVPEGRARRRRVTSEARRKIRQWRERRLSAGEIAQLLLEEGLEISVSTVERVLAEEGFPKLPRRTGLKIGRTVKGAEVPDRSEAVALGDLAGKGLACPGAGVFVFAPFLAKFDLNKIVRSAGLPGSEAIPARSYLLSFLALKLLGTERYAHVGDHAFDPGLGLFAGLNVLPKCTAMSTYAYGLDEVHLLRLQQAFVKQALRLRLYDEKVVNLDFHTVPHFGEESVLESHWDGSRGKRIKGALTLIAQDAQSKLILYTAADIQRAEQSDQVLDFVAFWKKVRRGVKPTLIFDSQFTTYKNLAQLDQIGLKFITLRKRGERLVKAVENLKPWTRILIPHAKRKHARPLVHDSPTRIQHYPKAIRQVVVRDSGHEKPTFLITNDFERPVELVLGDYARRWRVENGIAEAIKFFNLNALSSPILIKVQFDVIMTMMADTLYSMLAQHLRGFEACDSPKLFRLFVRGKADVAVEGNRITVAFPRRAHNPILRNVPWQRLPASLPCFPQASLRLEFK